MAILPPISSSPDAAMKELQSIVSMCAGALLLVSRSSTGSAAKLRQLQHEIENTSHIKDLRALKTQLEQSLAEICDEVAGKEPRTEETDDPIRNAMSNQRSAASSSEADLDLVTGLPNFQAAERAIRSAIASGTSMCAVLLCVDRLEVIHNRFGVGVRDRVLMLFGQHLAQRLSQTDRLFRWRGQAFLALLDRSGPEISMRAEVARMVSARLNQEIELGGRSVLLPITASWMLTNVADSTMEKIAQKFDEFTRDQPNAPATH